MIIGVPTETFPGERRVALIPASIAPLKKIGHDVIVQTGAGTEAGYPDAQYTESGAQIVASRGDVFTKADVVCQVRTLGANPNEGRADVALLRKGQTVVGMADPLSEPKAADELARQGVELLSLEMMPRITRAQSMDVLSSMATITGYKGVLLAANTLPKMFPLMMTAAGTLRAAHGFIVGAGVAGLQAIWTARKLGAIVEAYDVRPVVKEQVESLGAKFVEMALETGAAEDKGGYAKELGEDFYKKQRELMLGVVGHSDVVITTAAIPGRKAPILITKEMVEAMAPGSVVVDLAAERGGNCELTQPGKDIVVGGVTILGPTNPPAMIPYHASQMFAKNVLTYLQHLTKDGALNLDVADESVRETLITRGGEVVHARIRELHGLATASAEGGAA
jgi:NAD(P) transhydrogenase subunit alpha